MPNNPTTSWALTDLSGTPDELPMRLVIEDIGEFKVAQFTSTFALNEIPKATCLVAVGRDARNKALKKAKIHEAAPVLNQMKRATVYLSIDGDWDTTKREWREESEEHVVFEGYYTGFAYKKVSGKIQPIMHLTHWLNDLAFSSTLSNVQHPTNPTALVAPAVMPFIQKAGGAGPPKFIGHHVGYAAIRSKVKSDLWSGIKEMFCELANEDRYRVKCGLGLGDPDRWNARAALALEAMEGPAEGDGTSTEKRTAQSCTFKPKNADLELYDTPYEFGKPLQLNTRDVQLVEEAVASAVTNHTLESFAHTTFWDCLVGLYCPTLSMAVVPMINRALVVADCPAINKVYDKKIKAEEYSELDLQGGISRPLFGVGVYGDWTSLAAWQVSEVKKADDICLGGQFVAKADDKSDGVWLVVPAPPWLTAVNSVGLYAGTSSGVKKLPKPSATMPKQNPVLPKDKTPGQNRSPLRELYNAWAQTVFVQNMLRGRGASITGKLRFDIAPGSIVQIEPKPELFTEGVDELATEMYAHVVRVTVNINAEGSYASTSFEFNHLRMGPKEFSDPRTSVPEHPLYGPDIYIGGPLSDRTWQFK